MHKSAFVLCFYLSSGIILFRWQEGWSVTDSIYFIVAVTTTVGYGDVKPETPLGKIGACVFCLFGVAIAANAVEDLVEYVGETTNLHTFFSAIFGHSSEICLLDHEGVMMQKRVRLLHLMLLCVGWVGVGCLIGKYMLDLREWYDCVYFAVVTITTVGFGDFTPDRPMARVMTTLLMVVGVPVFGSAIANYVDLLHSEHIRSHTGDIARIRSRHLSDSAIVAIRRFQCEELQPGRSPSMLTREDFLTFVLVKNGICTESDIRAIYEDYASISANHRNDFAPVPLVDGVSPEALASYENLLGLPNTMDKNI